MYEDEPDVVYDFPRSYLKAVEEAVGDWIVYYEPVKAGRRGYFAVAKIMQVIPKPNVVGRFLALIEPGSFLPFDSEVPRLINGRPLESTLTAQDGYPKRGGLVQLAVRRLPEADFNHIVGLGLPENLERVEATRYDLQNADLADEATLFERPVIERWCGGRIARSLFAAKFEKPMGFAVPCRACGLEMEAAGRRCKRRIFGRWHNMAAIPFAMVWPCPGHCIGCLTED